MFATHILRSLYIKPCLFKCDVAHLSTISDVLTKDVLGKHIKVQGWVRALRKMKNNIFADVSDGSTFKPLQIVIPQQSKPLSLTYGSSITAEGKVELSENGQIELHVDDVRIVGTCNVMDGYPFAPRKVYSSEYIREYLHLRPRTKTFSALLRLRDIASSAFNSCLRNRGFISVHAPILTSNDCEGAGEVFVVKPSSIEPLQSMKNKELSEDEWFFNTKAYLTVSAQLHLECFARALSKVYTFGPTFRAENSKSRLHLSEFYMIEAELAFVSSIEQITKEVEFLIKSVTEVIIEKGSFDLQVFVPTVPEWLNKKFGHMSYDEALQILNNHLHQLSSSVQYGNAFTKEQELFLVQHNDQTPIFITNWPKESKPFYMNECAHDSSKVDAMDLLVPNVGELVGGSIRENNYEKLKSKLPLNANLSWYLELRKYGNVPTGGFGIGFERFLQFILGIENIKDTIPIPRWPHNCNF